MRKLDCVNCTRAGNACDGGAPAPPDCIARWPVGLQYADLKSGTSVLPRAPYKHPERAVVHAWHPGR